MKKIYEKPVIENVELVEFSCVMINPESGVADPDPSGGGGMMGKENNMWEESSDPVFQSNKKNLWDE